MVGEIFSSRRRRKGGMNWVEKFLRGRKNSLERNSGMS